MAKVSYQIFLANNPVLSPPLLCWRKTGERQQWNAGISRKTIVNCRERREVMEKCTWWKMWRRMWTASSLSVSQASTLAISTFLCIAESSSSHWRYSSILLIIIFLPELDVAGFWNKGAWFLITGWWVPTGRGGQESLTGSHLGCAQSIWGIFAGAYSCFQLHGSLWLFLHHPTPARHSPSAFRRSHEGDLPLQCLLKKNFYPARRVRGGTATALLLF